MSEREQAVTVRVMGEGDLAFAMRLKDQVGWNQVEADWRRFRALAPDGCFLAELAGEPVGTGLAICYGTKLAWIGMIIVAESARRHGVGRAIMAACLDHCRGRGVESIKLDATPLGNRLYLSLGFVEECLMDRRQGVGRRCETSESAKRMADGDLDEAIRLDAANFGVERGEVIGRLYREFPQCAFVRRDAAGRLAGLLLARRGQSAWQIGPWQADGPASAEELFQAALNALADQPIFFDVLGLNAAVLPLVSRYGFTHQRPFVRMFLGEDRCEGRPARVYAVSGVEKG